MTEEPKQGEKPKEKVGSNVYFHRMNICGTCPQMKRGLMVSRCELCGCVLALKARMKNESCPLGKW